MQPLFIATFGALHCNLNPQKQKGSQAALFDKSKKIKFRYGTQKARTCC